MSPAIHEMENQTKYRPKCTPSSTSEFNWKAAPKKPTKIETFEKQSSLELENQMACLTTIPSKSESFAAIHLISRFLL